ncbi:hypothetical protein Tco_1189699 [Tanacetum coccineum]
MGSWIGVPAKDSILAPLSDVDILEVEAQEVESFDLGYEVLILKSLEAKSFELTSEDLSLLSQETKSLDSERLVTVITRDKVIRF